MEDVLDVELEVCEDEDFSDQLMEQLSYPCLFLDGVETEEEVMFFKARSVESDAALPLYCRVDNIPLSLGTFELELHSLLTLRGIFDYKLTLYKSANNKVVLDLNNPEVLMKFIRL